MNGIKPRVERIEEFWKALVKLMLSKKEPIVGEVVDYMKEDKEFFQVFLSTIESDRRKVLLSAIRRILIESSEKIFSD